MTNNGWTMRVTHPLNRIWRHPGGFLEGCVITSYGIVYAYTQGGPRPDLSADYAETPSTTLQFVWDGRLHHRGIEKRFTNRGLVTKARQFAAEIVRNHVMETTP